jgi:predicted secreted Zn-dependent protease
MTPPRLPRDLARRVPLPTRRSPVAAILAVFVLLAIAATATAAVTKTTTYDVGGDQLADAWNDIQAKGPVDEGKTYAGQAETNLGVSTTPPLVQCQEVPSSDCPPDGMAWSCTATAKATYALSTEVLLPRWTGFDAACPEAKAEWTRFLAKLTEHEHGHDAAAQKAIDDAKPKADLSGGPAVDCDRAKAEAAAEAALDAAVDAEAERINQAIEQAHDAYDAATNHGATQGAVLNTSIVCPKEKTPAEQLQDLRDELDLLQNDGVRKSLQAKLDAALKSLEEGNVKAAKQQLDAFIKAVTAQSGKKLTKPVADQLIATAKAIRDAL